MKFDFDFISLIYKGKIIFNLKLKKHFFHSTHKFSIEEKKKME